MSRRIFFAFFLVVGVVLKTESKHLDELCVKHNSASYGKQTNQSLSPPGNPRYGASNAVDGNSTTCFNSTTVEMRNPWWKVDLGKEINVSVIMVKNSERTTTIRIFVSRDYRRGQLCGIEHVLEGREARVILCVPRVFGRYVTIEKIGKKRSLSLCEVQVFDKTVQLTEGVTYDAWFDVTEGNDYRWISFLKSLYNHSAFASNQPDSQGILPSFQSPRNITDHYGIRMTTYYVAPETGNYTFQLSGDNNCELFIRSPEQNKSEQIAIIPRWTDFNKSISSNPKTLQKDKVYELTALMKEGTGEDHLQVGVSLPSGQREWPLKNRIFTSEKAALQRIKDKCPYPENNTTTIAQSTDRQSEHGVNVSSVNTSDIEARISTTVERIESAETANNTKVLDELENLGLDVARLLTLGNRTFASFVSRKSNFVFAVIVVDLDKFNGFDLRGSLENSSLFDDGNMVFPKTIFNSSKGRASIVFMKFKPLKLMEKRIGIDKNFLGSDVLSGLIDPGPTNNLKEPVELIFENKKWSNNSERRCVFWIEDESATSDVKFGRWSDEGCRISVENQTHTICLCNHLTKFAVLFPVSQGSIEDETNLELITYVGLSLSAAGCFITFVVYCILRITRTLKAIVHLNLVLALGLADLIFLFGNLVENHKDACFAFTVLTFYLYLAVFAWMFVEGLHIYFLVIKVFGGDDHRRKKYYNLIGWGIPLIIVAITTGVLRYDLVAENHCWLSTKNGTIWAFVGPALLVLAINAFILGAVLRTTLTILSNDPGHSKEKSAIRTLAMLVPILGITWVFGVLTFARNSIVFQYIFAACNAFQGFFIFILYCLLNTEVRNEYQRRMKTWKTEREIETKRSKPQSFDALAL